MKRPLSILLAFSLTLNPVWGISATAPAAGATAGVDHKLELLRAMREAVDRRQFHIETLVDGLDWDADAIIAFVRDQIAFEQYSGLLRGSLGTLMSRAGNSLDQAVLLANLLKDAGFEARILQGRLAPGQARLLLGQMAADRPAEPHPVDREAWRALSGQLGEASLADPVDAVPATPEALDLVATTHDLLTAALRERPTAPSVDLVREAQEYFWVEVKGTSSQAWQAVHPAVPQGVEFAAPAPTAYFQDTIPAAFQHRVRIAVFIERAELGHLKVDQVVPDWERPAANLAGRSFALLNLPDGMAGENTDLDPREALESSELIVPVLNGQTLPGTLGFDLDGVLYDLEARGGNLAASALFQTAGEKVDRATAAISGLGSSERTPERARHLTAQWIDYTIIAPDGSERTHRRFMLDRIGADARARGDLSGFSHERAQPWQLLIAEEFLVATGTVPRALALDEQLNERLADTELQRQLIVDGRLDFRKLTTESRGPDAAALMTMLRSLDAGLDEAGSGRTYRPAPTLIALSWHLPERDVLSVATDMIGTRHRSTNWQNPTAARRDVQLRGIWETVAEGRILAAVAPFAGERQSPFTVIEDASESRSALTVIDPSSLGALSRLGLPADQRQMIANQVSEGASVVLLPGQHANRFAWWRIDPVDGTAIGFLPNGRGSETLKYAVFIVAFGALILGGVRTHGGYLRRKWECTKKALSGELYSQATLATEEQPTMDQCMAGAD